MITEKKWTALKQWMAELGINELDIQEKYVKGAGRGGQKVNKSSSCVQLFYAPQEITIKCQSHRMRENNRYEARKRLCQQVDAIINKQQSKQVRCIDKIRKQKSRRRRRRDAPGSQ